MRKKEYPAPIEGTTHVNTQVPTALHEDMRTLRNIRHLLEGADVKLCRLYREAVQAYINAPQQQELLRKHKRRTLRALA